MHSHHALLLFMVHGPGILIYIMFIFIVVTDIWFQMYILNNYLAFRCNKEMEIEISKG